MFVLRIICEVGRHFNRYIYIYMLLLLLHDDTRWLPLQQLAISRGLPARSDKPHKKLTKADKERRAQACGEIPSINRYAFLLNKFGDTEH